MKKNILIFLLFALIFTLQAQTGENKDSIIGKQVIAFESIPGKTDIMAGMVKDFMGTNIKITDSNYDYTNPVVTVGSEGFVYMACQSTHAGKEHVDFYYSTNGGMTWIRLTSLWGLKDLLNPSIAAAGDYVYIAFENTLYEPTRIDIWRYQRSTSTPNWKTLNYSGLHNYHNPYIFTNAYSHPNDFKVFVVAEEEYNADNRIQNIAFWKTEDKGENWTDVSYVRWSPGISPKKWSSPHGSWGADGSYLYVTCYQENDRTIYLDRSGDDGDTFTLQKELFTLEVEPNNPPLPQVAAATATGNSNIMVVFTYPFAVLGSFANDHIAYLYSTNNGGSWSSIGFLANSAKPEYAPRLHANEKGGSWHALWFNETDKVLEYRSTKHDSPSSWSSAVTLNSIFHGSQNALSSFWDSDDAAIVTRNYNDDDIYFTRGDSGFFLIIFNPNGGESLVVGSTESIVWITYGYIPVVSLEYSTDNGSNWNPIESSMAITSPYDWVVPNTPSNQCLIRVHNPDYSIVDQSDAVFSIVAPTTSSLTITSPNGGEEWEVGSTHDITWTSTGTVGNVRIRYSTDGGSNWIIVTNSTPNDGSFSWTVPNTPSTNCLITINEINQSGLPYDISNSTFSILSAGPPQIFLNRTQLNYGATTSGISTPPQIIFIDNSGGGTLNWSATDNVSWLNCSPSSGTNAGYVTVSVDPTELSAGTYTGEITVTDPNASNSPQTVSVKLKVYGSGQTAAPFGEYATPTDGSTVSSSIPVTGWVLDDIGIESVKIYRGNIGSLVYIGDAVFVEGARPDIEQAYPDYPMNYKAGWGYMMLTNFLPNGGNGTFKIHAIATDMEGHQVTLGTKTIIVDNASAVKPFGAIDTPTQGGTASGSSFINWGWALTPQPNKIPTDGSTIQVLVNSVNIGNPTYNIYRADIASLFPGYANSNGAVGYFSLDTTAYANGVHTIFWIATDNGGNADGIGSRYFTIQNTGSSRSGSKIAGSNQWKPIIKTEELSNLPFNYFEPIKIKKGYGKNIQSKLVQSDEKNIFRIEIRELERIELKLSNVMAGYMLAGNKIYPFPIGSTLDTKNGKFSWIPGPGFYGNYRMVFVVKDQYGELSKQEIQVDIVPKFGINK